MSQHIVITMKLFHIQRNESAAEKSDEVFKCLESYGEHCSAWCIIITSTTITTILTITILNIITILTTTNHRRSERMNGEDEVEG